MITQVNNPFINAKFPPVDSLAEWDSQLFEKPFELAFYAKLT